jgi:hypothetical protein
MVVVRRVEAEDVDDYGRRLAAVTIGTPQRVTGAIVLTAYDPAWGDAYGRHAARIRGALDQRALQIVIGCGATVPIAISAPEQSENSLRAGGPTCSSTPTRRPQ